MTSTPVPDGQLEEPHVVRIRGKKLALSASASGEQWDDYKEAVCPLLQEFGFFNEP